MDDPTILLEVSGGIGVVRFNRPAALNAIDRAMASALRAAVEALAQDAEVRVVVFRGDARAFSVGADLRERQSMTPEETWAHTQA
ncbi:MAG: enoyl-CoA hydratase/isomerase family protein, partial [Thermomicrobiaceae bacterium]|nr:enoyl-CoA hydratase/isomerase family protein [Thermomicrobiaceae bacterium]